MLLRSLSPLVLACCLVLTHPAAALDKDALLELLDSDTKLVELTEAMAAIEGSLKAKEGDRRALTKERAELRKQINVEKGKISKRSKACRDWFKATGGQDINAQDAKGMTLLMLVADAGNDEAVALLMQEEPRLDLLDRHGKSALDHEIAAKQGSAIRSHMEEMWVAAFAEGDAATISMLLEAGLPANTHAGEEAGPVLALANGNTEILALLLAHNTTLKARDSEGRDLLEIAIRTENAKAISMLCAAGMGKDSLSSGHSPFFHLVTHGNAPCLKAFLDSCTALDDAARRALPPMVVRYGTAEMVGDSIPDAATANAQDDNGNIPVHEAARRGDMDILRLVLERGGSRTATNSAGESTLMHAALSGNQEAVALVLEGLRPADINHKDKKGHTAAKFAEESGNNQVLETLRAAGLKH